MFVTQSPLQAGAAAPGVPRVLLCSGARSPAHTPEGWAACRSSLSANVATSGKSEHQEDWHGGEEPCSDLWVAGRCQGRAQAGAAGKDWGEMSKNSRTALASLPCLLPLLPLEILCSGKCYGLCYTPSYTVELQAARTA